MYYKWKNNILIDFIGIVNILVNQHFLSSSILKKKINEKICFGHNQINFILKNLYKIKY